VASGTIRATREQSCLQKSGPTNRRQVPMTGLAAIPIAAVLLAQAFLSIRILHVSAASGDEALYIYSGHQLIHELWHGGGSPYYETYFSGAPVIYPVLAAMMDHLGGLTLVRLISGAFMLVATGLLYLTTKHIFGYWPGVVASALFASLGITQGLGAYATFDAMSLMLIAFAAYCATKAATSSKWLLAIPVILLFANATKYASILFDPIVVLLAAFILGTEGGKRVWYRALALTGTTALLLVVATLLAGTAYLKGILFTTIDRKTATGILDLNPASPHTIVIFTWSLIGLALALGVLSTIVALIEADERRALPLLTLFVIAGILVTLEAVHLRDLTSVNKHDDFGAWFTSIAAGYALARPVELAHSWYIRAIWIIPAAVSIIAALHLYSNHAPIAKSPNMDGVSVIVPYLQVGSNNRYLIGGKLDDVIMYDYHLAIPWQRNYDDNFIKYPIPGRGGDASGSVRGLACSSLAPRCVYLVGAAAARAAIHAHWFAVVSFLGQNYLPIDRVELEAVRTTWGYKLVSTVGGDTYIYAPDYSECNRLDSTQGSGTECSI
jgi:4-amino-4-deoxy-L-arabinose transferase-like glycosyltransferase